MSTHNHHHCMTSAIESAERLCAQKGIRFTETRRKVLQLIWESHQAAKAYDLLDRIKSSDQGATPMTIYRALQFLQDQGLIHRVETLNAYIGCNCVGRQHEVILLICEACLQISERPEPEIMKRIHENIARTGFRTKRSTIEIYGTCRECAEPLPGSH